MNLTINLFFLLLVSGNRWAIEISCLSSVTPMSWPSSCVRFAGESKGNIGIPEISRQSLLEYANWCINCVLMRVMERRERDGYVH